MPITRKTRGGPGPRFEGLADKGWGRGPLTDMIVGAIPGAGEAMDAYDLQQGLSEGDYWKAGAAGAGLAIPFVGGPMIRRGMEAFTGRTQSSPDMASQEPPGSSEPGRLGRIPQTRLTEAYGKEAKAGQPAYEFRETKVFPRDPRKNEPAQIRRNNIRESIEELPSPRRYEKSDKPTTKPYVGGEELGVRVGTVEGQGIQQDLKQRFQEEIDGALEYTNDAQRNADFAEFMNEAELPEEVGPNGLTLEQLGVLQGRLTNDPGFLDQISGDPRTSGMVRRTGVVAEDALGTFRPSTGLQVLLKSSLPRGQMRDTLSHELGHAIMGIRDADATTNWMQKQVERSGAVSPADWTDQILPELMQNSMLNARPRSWEAAMRPGAYDKLVESMSDQRQLALHGDVDSIKKFFDDNYTKFGRYLTEDAELSADALSTMMTKPGRAKETMPMFSDLVKQIAQQDPQLRGKIKFAAAPVMLAATALNRHERQQQEQNRRQLQPRR